MLLYILNVGFTQTLQRNSAAARSTQQELSTQ